MKAHVTHVRISPKKASLVAGLVREKKAVEAVNYLQFVPKKAAGIIRKLILSAIANAENNDMLSRNDLYVSSLYVTKGGALRRGIPSSRGRVMPIKKYLSHIFVELSVLSEGAVSKKSKKAAVSSESLEVSEEPVTKQKKTSGASAVKKAASPKKTSQKTDTAS